MLWLENYEWALRIALFGLTNDMLIILVEIKASSSLGQGTLDIDQNKKKCQ